MQFDKYQIRPLVVDDLGSYFDLVSRNRSRLEDFFTGTVSRTKTLEDTRQFVEEITRKAEEKTYFPFVIVDMETGGLIGYMDLKNIDWNIPKTEIGGWIDADHANQGIVSQAFRLLCDHCLHTMGFNKLFFRTHATNFPVHRIAEKAGFEKEGLIRKDYKTTAGELIDLVYYGRISDTI
jgi:ribosomal-protein-serine acetyltransferase